MSDYLRYIIKNLEPVRVADLETSQSGQTGAVRYLPGSAIRGVVVNALATEEDFSQIKHLLFQAPTAFLNAYPTMQGQSLVPSPKGFYEDKVMVEGPKEIQNVVLRGDFSDGMKRASLGNFCYWTDECIYYYSVKISSELKVMVNPGKGQKRNVFRQETLAPGQVFEGYVRLTGQESVDHRICQIFTTGDIVKIGNARSTGLGACRVVSSERVIHRQRIGEAFKAEKECYLMLLSDTQMRDKNGEYCGLDLHELERLMGVTNLQILFASTSVNTVFGYNRTWGGKLPTVPAYTAGSVFHLVFDGTISAEKMRSLCEEGIGVRRNEGMGEICFLKDYEKIHLKQSGVILPQEGMTNSRMSLSEREKKTLETAAKGYYRQRLEKAIEEYVLTHPLKKNGVKNSQLGQIEARLVEFRYDPTQASSALKGYFGHAADKEKKQKVQKERALLTSLEEQVMGILMRPIEETVFEGKTAFRVPGQVMGIPVNDLFAVNSRNAEEENARYRIKLLVRMIRFDRKRRAK